MKLILKTTIVKRIYYIKNTLKIEFPAIDYHDLEFIWVILLIKRKNKNNFYK